MKTTVGKLVAAKPALSKIANNDIPVDVGFKIARIIRKFDQEVKLYDEQRTKLVTKYGTRGDGGNITVGSDKIDVFREELEKVLSIEIDVDIPTIKVSDLKDVKLTPLDLLQLEIFFEPDAE